MVVSPVPAYHRDGNATIPGTGRALKRDRR